MSKNIQINIIAPNIKNGGGRELLEYLLLYLDEMYKDINTVVYIDSSLKNIKSTNSRSVVKLSNTIDKIRLFFRKIDNGVYFGNLPPAVKSSNSMVYFHNTYLLMDAKSLYRESASLFFKYSLQRLYINYFIRNVDFVGCQNKKIKKEFIDKYNYTKVELLPFYRSCSQKKYKSCKKIYDFCYVSLAHPHKNHKLLFEALEILGKKGLSISVVVTIEDDKNDLISQLNQINALYQVQIINLGEITKEEVCVLYQETRCLIFPSTLETFGLGLVEAVDMGLDVIAADLPYTHEVISTSFLFNPKSALGCAIEIERYLNAKFPPKSSKILENNIESLINKFNRSKDV
jgi:glycosyltransferase involved in cell wall biosynthesis